MTSCLDVTKNMLDQPMEIRTDRSLNFSEARALADHEANRIDGDPMLLAWFDRSARRFSPDVICCDTSKPTWLVYAEKRGGTISVDINDEDYVFIYRPGM
ncbi:MAG: AF1514 family protein [Desulfomonile tiedjei]|uniref:AF1514 family protein n=1 Tax=Desulfomonile tiedjei TaxID=2358 RepID=A0A9D6V653_9BACT|nr:AF1514 family protein [Desulfomonile tiedjei]